jgi:RHH-type proline utilization regulon transcriptional repressor/proline dehydrogenase/delta 1-pyrroline-5-carboxylate dehydrogenase
MELPAADAYEPEVQALARLILERTRPPWHRRVAQRFDLDDRLLAWAVTRPEFKVALFRFVDVFPAATDRREVVAHLREYLDTPASPVSVRRALRLAGALPGGERLLARATAAGIHRMARRFIVGSDPGDAVRGLQALWDAGFASTVDLLGEKTVTERDADRYAARVAALLRVLAAAAAVWPERPLLEHDPWGRVPRVNVSVKPSAIAPLLRPTTLRAGLRQARARLDPILELAREVGATVVLDGEHDELKDPTLALLREICGAWPDGPQLGCVVQAYRRDAEDDLRSLLGWSAATLAAPMSVRLVKGAYWDVETVHARAEGWPSPVWTVKATTDARYEHLTRVLIGAAGDVRPALAGHNARSLAHGIVAARAAGLPEGALELQVLHGMAEPLHAALRDLGERVRVYAPVGALAPGMAYLVRRLLENTSNESFVRHHFLEHVDVEEAIAAPRPPASDTPAAAETPGHAGPFRNEPHAELRRSAVQARLAGAVRRLDASLPIAAPVLVGGDDRTTPRSITSVDPAHPGTVVCTSGMAGAAEVDEALARSAGAAARWAAAGFEARARVLADAAAIMRAERDDLTALVVREAGKPLAEADADTCEAIDFLEYYARRAGELAAGRALPEVPGERNHYWYQPRGVAVVIAPWNFPLAIPTGMVSAALAAGNPVVLKPAEQTPGIARRLVEILLQAGVLPDALHCLPGTGEEIGPLLVEDPRTALVAFTGSRAVGLEIVQRAAVTRPGQRHVKRVIAEMGGKNAIVIDADADLDEAVPEVVQSAFGYAGQKCSAAARAVVHARIYDAFVERLIGATELVPVGDPADPGTVCGPLIDADARERVLRYQERAVREGEVLVQRRDLPAEGWYVGPTVVAVDDPAASVACDEIFGPLLAVLRAADFDDAIRLANLTDYALTAGVFSRTPSHLERAAHELRAGNVYLNRGITGAMVGRHPFGGYGLSGVGSKAGGPDYLLQFVEPRSVSENTIRQGFPADTE